MSYTRIYQRDCLTALVEIRIMGLREFRADLRARFSRYSENEYVVKPRVRGALDLRHTCTHICAYIHSLVQAVDNCCLLRTCSAIIDKYP